MNLVFFDGIPWDYDVATPLERPLGGSQSALCYLAVELARRGHAVTLFSGTRRPGRILGVECLPHGEVPAPFLSTPLDAFIVLNGPAELGLTFRPHLHPATPLVLWTQHAVDQPAMHSLARPEVRASWDVVVCISEWHRATMIAHYGLEPTRVCILRNAIAPVFEGLFASVEELVAAKGDRPVLAYTSTPFRGLDVLLYLFPEVRRAWPGAELRVYSSMQVYQVGQEADHHRALYDRCRTLPGVVYLGSRPQPVLARDLRQAAILAYPNTFAETGCIAAMEAMAAGLLVVSSDLGALPETTMGFGVLVPPAQGQGDVWGFASRYYRALDGVLRHWHADPRAFAAQRAAQVRAVHERCTWRVRAGEWEQALPGWRGLRRGGKEP
ncbi:MAG: glycosyltransferase family 4 protein [Gemmataceae bacterium]|nr:glycosyltransferase family 4 protein [Gemmataceae bacterium]MDW8265137.1 glycosyltransferase family 4 protein [Gemmataceae bacterium]